MTTPLWTSNVPILYEKKYLFEIIPNKHFDFNRKLNSLLRLSIYYSLIVFMMDKSKSNVFYIPFVVGIITYVLSNKFNETMVAKTKTELMNMNMNMNDGDNELIQKLENECKIPNIDNPFMNPEIYDYNTGNMEDPSCYSYNNKGVQMEIDKKFNSKLYRGVDDIFGKNNSQRQFYTVPGNSIPNDQDSFAKWLYKTPPTCKEGNGVQCAANQYGVIRGPGGDDF